MVASWWKQQYFDRPRPSQSRSRTVTARVADTIGRAFVATWSRWQGRLGSHYRRWRHPADLSDDQFAAICAQIETALMAVTNGIMSPTVPSYDIQIENYRVRQE